jgi:hypothetical protein
MSRQFWEEEAQFLCSPQAIEDEESYLIEHGQTELPHRELVERWQRMLCAKDWLQEQFSPPVEHLPEQSTTSTSGCRVCLSTPCSCEDYRR